MRGCTSGGVVVRGAMAGIDLLPLLLRVDGPVLGASVATALCAIGAADRPCTCVCGTSVKT